MATKTTVTTHPYTPDQSELDIATLRGQVDLMNEVITKNDATDPPNTPASGLIHYSTSGQHKYASSDGNYYSTGCLRQQVSPRSQSFSSTSAASIGGLSALVVPGTYIARSRMVIEWNATSGNPEIRFAGPAISQFDVSFKSQQSATSSTTNNLSTVSSGTGGATGYNTGGVGGFINPTQAMTAAGIFFDLDAWGMFTFTASGTLILQAASDTATKAWIVLSGFWEVLPFV